MCSYNSTHAQEESNVVKPAMVPLDAHAIFQAAYGLPIAFSASVEGAVIEMKPATPVPEDNMASPKA